MDRRDEALEWIVIAHRTGNLDTAVRSSRI
jgi:hypothetical protein